MVDIDALLHRRADLSTFLVHLTRDTDSGTARDNLLSILAARTIEARSPLGMAKTLQPHLANTIADQRVVCFTETPLEHVWMMVQQIDDRQIHLRPYGLATLKASARLHGANPVWYLDITPGHNWLTVPANALVDQAKAIATDASGQLDAGVLAEQPILRLTPFLEQMGPTNLGRKEFWWEREWRRIGDYALHPDSVVCVFAPENEHLDLRGQINNMDRWAHRNVPILDPSWGLERMITDLSGAFTD